MVLLDSSVSHSRHDWRKSGTVTREAALVGTMGARPTALGDQYLVLPDGRRSASVSLSVLGPILVRLGAGRDNHDAMARTRADGALS